LSAYGAVAAEAAIANLDSVLDQLGGEAGMFEVRRPGLVELSFGHGGRADVADALELALGRLSGEPVRLPGCDLHLALSCVVAGDEGSCALPDYEAAGDEGAWAERYRRNMSLAAEALAAMREGRLHLSWQPVRSAAAPAQILYSEALARVVGRDGRVLSPSAFIPAMEALGLMRHFDRRIVTAVLDELENFPAAVLGVNISAQSARLDVWWVSMLARLRRSPDMARRLVVEITESAALHADAHAFVRELRRLGCRVALDDFGVGHASVRNAMALGPDIIKVDGFFLKWAGSDPANYTFLEHMIGVAGVIAPVVIVEGVETAEQSRMAATLQSQDGRRSPCWQQGHHLGCASVWRSWTYSRDGDEAVRSVPLRELSERPRAFHGGEGLA